MIAPPDSSHGQCIVEWRRGLEDQAQQCDSEYRVTVDLLEQTPDEGSFDIGQRWSRKRAYHCETDGRRGYGTEQRHEDAGVPAVYGYGRCDEYEAGNAQQLRGRK